MSVNPPNPTKIPVRAPGTLPPEAKPPKQHASRSHGLLIAFIVLLLLFAGAVYFFGVLPRLIATTALDTEQKISSQRIVIYAEARLAAPKVILPLPGTLEAFQQASIYARTNGYVKRWLVDIGDVVKGGDLLAELDTPEVDQQLSQAEATVVQASAAKDIAQTAADRWDTMSKAHAVSQEEADEKDATLEEAKATLVADQANVGQLSAMENFKRIVAPFTGTITYRNIEVGNLVSSGSGTTTGTNATTSAGRSSTSEIYRIAQTDPLRLYVDVPESNTRSIQPGVEADVHVGSYPDRLFHGKVVRSAGSLDVTSRTLRTEIHVPNPDGTLLPGTFAEVSLNLVDGAPSILIPANTLIVNSAGTQVALVQHFDGKDTVHFLPVKVGRDFGTEVEIVQDVNEGDRLVTNPAADLTEGAIVTAKPLPRPPVPAPANPLPKS